MFNKTSKSVTDRNDIAPKGEGFAAPRSPRSHTGMPSIVSVGLKVIGNMVSDGDIQIEGTVEGDVKSRMLTIGESGIVNGSVIADEVAISGTVSGHIKARSISLTRSARVTGDLIHETVSVEAGAQVEGKFKRMATGAESTNFGVGAGNGERKIKEPSVTAASKPLLAPKFSTG